MTRKPNRRARRQGPGWKTYLLAFVLTIGTGLGAGLLVGGAFDPSLNGGPSAGDPTATESANANGGGFSLLPRLKQPMNVLVMATDVHYEFKDGRRVMGLNGNTDTMILVRFDPTQDQVRMLSIPRDTRVPIPGHGTFKINAANPYGGPPLAAQTVSDFLGVTVDRYVLFNTRAVVQLVDAMGGIDVMVPKRMYYNDYAGGLHINFRKGLNHMDGKNAHDFLRFRHDELGDIGRVQRNQAFLQAVIKQYMTPANLLKTPELLSVAKQNLETNLTNDELMQIATWGKDLKQENIEFAMVPGVAGPIQGVSFWLPDVEGTQRVVQSFLTNETTPEAKTPNLYRVAIRDGVGDRTGTRSMRKLLREAGYAEVALDGLASELNQEETQIIAQKADVAGANALASALGVGKVVVAATGNIYTDFTVVVGRDWLDRQAAATAAPSASATR